MKMSNAMSTLIISTFMLFASNSFAANVNGKLDNYKGSGYNFTYVEKKYGKGAGNRGIRIMSDTRDQSYKFSPNPHSDRWYNKNQQQFYRIAAESLSDYYLSKEKFPRYGFKAKINNIEYKLTNP